MARTIRQRALKEMRHRAVGAGFRPAALRGQHPKAIRAEALSRRAEEFAGAYVVAFDPGAPELTPMVGMVALGAGIALGYVLGKVLRKYSAAYLAGIDAALEA